MRAQPFHVGHQLLIKRMLAECETGIVLFGSAQESRTKKNPFTLDERKKMIAHVFGKKIKEGRITVDGIEDLNDYPRWAAFVLNRIGFKPDVYYCGSAKDGELFAAKGIRTTICDREKMFADPISATRIREALENGNPEWTRFVDAKTKKLIEQTYFRKGK